MFYLQNNKGIAVVFTPNEGVLHPHSEIPITVTLYNNACGKFDDIFRSQIKGLPTFDFPISIKIDGSPIVIPENQVGLSYGSVPPLIQFPIVVENSPQIVKHFKIKNTGIADVELNWNVFDQRDLDKEEGDIFDIKIVPNSSFDYKDQPFKLEFNRNEPEPSQNSPFIVEPANCIIPSKQTMEF